MCCRSALISGSGATLTSVGWGAASMMRSAQWAEAFKSPSGWPARMALTLESSRLDQMLWRKSSGASGARLMRCQKLGRLAVTHFECQELMDAFFFQGEQQFHQFGLQCGVGVTLQRGGDMSSTSEA
jgi:hypothetical protein